MDLQKLQNYTASDSPVRWLYYPEIDSTNTRAMKLARAGEPEWTVVTADRQIAGKGRLNRSWVSPAGMGLYFSVILRPFIDIREVSLLNLATALGIRNFLADQIESPPQRNVQVKWPNDILVDHRKICGILLESEMERNKLRHLVIGIGLNVNQRVDDFPKELQKTAISLKIVTKEEWEIERLLSEILIYFYTFMQTAIKNDFSEIVNQYEKNMVYREQPVTVQQDDRIIEGIVKGITDFGFLKLNTGDGEVVLTVGEVVKIKGKDKK